MEESKVSKEEIQHIAKLARLKLKEDEIDQYVNNLQDILDFANTINKANVGDVDVTIGSNDSYNVFRKDEVQQFENLEGLLQNAKTKEENMFKIPKVL